MYVMLCSHESNQTHEQRVIIEINIIIAPMIYNRNNHVGEQAVIYQS